MYSKNERRKIYRYTNYSLLEVGSFLANYKRGYRRFAKICEFCRRQQISVIQCSYKRKREERKIQISLCWHLKLDSRYLLFYWFLGIGVTCTIGKEISQCEAISKNFNKLGEKMDKFCIHSHSSNTNSKYFYSFKRFYLKKEDNLFTPLQFTLRYA